MCEAQCHVCGIRGDKTSALLLRCLRRTAAALSQQRHEVGKGPP